MPVEAGVAQILALAEKWLYAGSALSRAGEERTMRSFMFAVDRHRNRELLAMAAPAHAAEAGKQHRIAIQVDQNDPT